MFTETLGVDRGRGDDDLEVGAGGQQPLEVAEDEVDVQAALVGLVDDQGVVAAQLAVPLHLGQQDPVGHHLDLCAVAGLVGEPDLVTDGRAEFGAQFLGDAFGHGTRRDPAGLGVADLAVDAAAELQADLRQLGGFTRAGLARDDDRSEEHTSELQSPCNLVCRLLLEKKKKKKLYTTTTKKKQHKKTT